MSRRTGSAPGRAAALLLLAALPGRAGAGEVQLTAELDRDRIALGQTVALRVRLVSDVPPLQLDFSAGRDLQVVLAERSTGTDVSVDERGLSMRRTHHWVFSLRPLRAGTIVVPGPTAVFREARVRHQDLILRVARAGGPPASGVAPGPPGGISGGRAPGAPGQAAPGDDDDDGPRDQPGSLSWKGWQRDLALRLRLDKREAFVGEQVTASVDLVSPVPVVRFDGLRPPALDGFWSEVVKVQPSEHVEVLDGIPMRVIPVARSALFPVRPGPGTVEPYTLDFSVQIASRDPFGLFPEVRQAQRRTAAATVRVKALPPGAPVGFEPGNVGDWSLSIEGPPGPQPAGQPFPVRLLARGRGNVRALRLPSVPAVAGLRIFDPVVTDDPRPAGDRLGGTRTVETMVALEAPGTLELPPIEWVFFDPRSTSYQRVRTPSLQLEAGPARPAPAPSAAGLAALVAELRPLRTDAPVELRAAPAWRARWLAFVLAAAPLLFALAAAGQRLRDRLAGGEAERRRRRAAGVARRRLQAARRRMVAGDAGGFHEEVARALAGYAADRLGGSLAGLTSEALAGALAEAGAGAAAGLFARALEACDAGRFGGPARMPLLLSRAEEALSRLEESEWRGAGRGA